MNVNKLCVYLQVVTIVLMYQHLQVPWPQDMQQMRLQEVQGKYEGPHLETPNDHTT